MSDVVSYFEVLPKRKMLRAIGGMYNGYMFMRPVMYLADNELELNAGRFALWSDKACQIVTQPFVSDDVQKESFIHSTIDWCADNCTARWNIELNAQSHHWHMEREMLVSFDDQRDADNYLVCFALNRGYYRGSYDL